MNRIVTMKEFTSFYPFCGLGLGARGFLNAQGQLGLDGARFKNLGGIDIEEESCADFEMLTGTPAMRADVAKVTPAELLAWLTKVHGAEVAHRRPDAVFTSPPCKGYSRLLGSAKSQEDKYQALNMLVFHGLFLMCETWKEPPPLILLENVPGIVSRGKEILEKAQQLLRAYGYVFHRATHDCGEIGGLAQHRKRFLLIARHPKQVPAYVYQPPKQRVRACGEVLQELPIPGSDDGGELHKLPRLSWLNWVRLAMIPPGGDWRDLPKASQPHQDNPNAHRNKFAPSVADPRMAALAMNVDASKFKGSPGLMGVLGWDQPSKAVTGSASVSGSNGTAAVADPRPFGNVNRVTPWDAPVGTITSSPAPSSGGAAVADPRVGCHQDATVQTSVLFPELCSPLKPGADRRSEFPKYDVRGWDEPARTVAGSGTNGGFGVADPRVALGHTPNNGTFGVNGWGEPTKCVRGRMDVRTGPAAVADPRPFDGGRMGVVAWTDPVADPRVMEMLPSVPLKCDCRNGSYGVMSWEEAAKTITGSASIDNGTVAVADPRKPPAKLTIIIAADGTWHRPLTTLELAALQGMPMKINGKWLKLAGKSIAGWRERIGNAVPEGAARAIAETLLKALLAASLGTWFLSPYGEPIWVRRDGTREDAFELGEGDAR